MAANSDSTFTNSQGCRSPLSTSRDRPSTMCVCGEIGYAQMSSGRQRATVSATSTEPPSCLSTDRHLPPDLVVGPSCGGDVAIARLAAEPVGDRARERLDADE